MEEDVERQFSDPRSYYTIIKAVLKPGDGKPVFRVIVPPCAISISLVLEDMYPASYLWGPLNGHCQCEELAREEDGRSIVQGPTAQPDLMNNFFFTDHLRAFGFLLACLRLLYQVLCRKETNLFKMALPSMRIALCANYGRPYIIFP